MQHFVGHMPRFPVEVLSAVQSEAEEWVGPLLTTILRRFWGHTRRISALGICGHPIPTTRLRTRRFVEDALHRCPYWATSYFRCLCCSLCQCLERYVNATDRGIYRPLSRSDIPLTKLTTFVVAAHLRALQRKIDADRGSRRVQLIKMRSVISLGWFSR